MNFKDEDVLNLLVITTALLSEHGEGNKLQLPLANFERVSQEVVTCDTLMRVEINMLSGNVELWVERKQERLPLRVFVDKQCLFPNLKENDASWLRQLGIKA